jgi:hypothetical protein
VPQLLRAQDAGQFEQPPTINTTQLLPESTLSGPGFHVDPQVPTNGAMGQYTIVADASVFQNDAGTYRVESLDLLKIRLSEIPAIAYLETVSKTGVFANALAQSAARPVTAAANMVIHPMDTVGLPSGIGGLAARYVGSLICLAFLAPDIVESIVEGRQPTSLTAEAVTRHIEMPPEWHSQRTAPNIPRLSAAGKATCADFTPEERSIEMKRRAAIRKHNRRRKELQDEP